MLTIDDRCTDPRCTHKTGIYRMVGYCLNCGANPILFLITEAHEARSASHNGATCPVCGCRKAVTQRLATEAEFPEADVPMPMPDSGRTAEPVDLSKIKFIEHPEAFEGVYDEGDHPGRSGGSDAD